jgi:hypothetical protein
VLFQKERIYVFNFRRAFSSSYLISLHPHPTFAQALLSTTQRVVQEIDSVEYGLTDIQVRLVFFSPK